MNDRNKRVISILTIFTIIFTVMGGSLAYWNWSSTEASRTGVAFTIDKDFSCSADGGGHITPSNISLEPSTCTNPNTSIKRKIVVTPDIKKSGLEISLDMWLNVNSLGTGLSNSVNLKYVLTTSESSCEEGTIISSGNFNSKTSGDRVMLLEKNYTADASETYYLYIWLDKEETSMDTMNQSFDFSIGGNCSNYVGEPEAPVLDSGMIPVTIANDGTVTTVSKDDPNWYDYSNKEWANIVLVNEKATDGVTDSHPRSYYQNNIGEEVTEEDILAYYVWIPRYKYKIPTNKYCYEIENPTMETHPECYTKTDEINISYEELKKIVNDYVESYDDAFCPWVDNIEEVCEDFDESGDYSEDECWEEDVGSGYVCSDSEIEEYTNALLAGEGIYNGNNLKNVYLKDLLEYSDYNYELALNKIINNGPTSIDIIFEAKDENMILGNATTQYRSHPAFWWDDNNNNVLESGEMLSGIWIGKFENTVSSSITEEICEKEEFCDLIDEECDEDGENCVPIEGCWEEEYCTGGEQENYATILPNQNGTIWEEYDSGGAIEYNPINHFLNESLNKGDEHNFKYRDWGAAAYLSHSVYGINKEVGLKGTTITGCGIQNGDDCATKYGSGISEYPQSTTGNITGIFDMSGGAELPSITFGSTVNTKYSDAFIFDDDISSYYPDADTMYMDTIVFDDQIACNGTICYGYAMTETKKWYSDSFGFNTYFDDRPLYKALGSNGIFSLTTQSYWDDAPIGRSVIVVK